MGDNVSEDALRELQLNDREDPVTSLTKRSAKEPMLDQERLKEARRYFRS
jgi:hypothetical protein